MKEIVNERTNLLVDYFGKFISREVVESHQRSNQSLISNEAVCKAESERREKENCLATYIDYLETRKQPQLAGLIRAFEKISEYFKRATTKCEGVVEREHCVTLIVSDFS